MKDKEKRGMWKKEMILLVILLILIIQIDSASAVGISPAKRTIDYQPGKTERFSYGIYNNERLESTVKLETIGGKLKENIVFSESEINFSAGELMRQVETAISFPDSTIDQDEFIDIVAKETQKKGAFVNVQLEVRSKIEIKAPPKEQEEAKVEETKKEERKEEKQEQKIEEKKIQKVKKEGQEISEEGLNKILAGALIVLAIMQVYLTIYQISLSNSLKKETKSKKKAKKWKKNKKRKQ